MLIGTGYIALQAMAYSGYIDVKWGKVRKTRGRHCCCIRGGGVKRQLRLCVFGRRRFRSSPLSSFAPPPSSPPSPPLPTQVSDDFKKIVDADGDGKITKKDALVYYQKV